MVVVVLCGRALGGTSRAAKCRKILHSGGWIVVRSGAFCPTRFRERGVVQVGGGTRLAAGRGDVGRGTNLARSRATHARPAALRPASQPPTCAPLTASIVIPPLKPAPHRHIRQLIIRGITGTSSMQPPFHDPRPAPCTSRATHHATWAGRPDAQRPFAACPDLDAPRAYRSNPRRRRILPRFPGFPGCRKVDLGAISLVFWHTSGICTGSIQFKSIQKYRALPSYTLRCTGPMNSHGLRY